MKQSLIYFPLLFLFAFNLSYAGDGVKFIENKGQWNSNAIFKAEIKGGYLYLEKNRLTFDLLDTKTFNRYIKAHHDKELPKNFDKLNWHAYNIEFIGANSTSKPSGQYKSPEYYNYFLGKDKTKWASNANAYYQINYSNIYDGISLNLYSSDDLKYDIIVSPNGNTKNIKLKYNGVDEMTLKKGQIHIKTSVNKIIEDKPYAYQVINNNKIQVECNYTLQNHIVGFEFPNGYNKNYNLVIDPTLIFSTFSGSFSNNFGYSATFDSKGFLYSGSSAFGNNYPTTIGAYDTNFNGGIVDIAISKFDTSGTFLIYSTYIGGSSDELPHSLIVNSFDELFILGTTSSLNFPTTTNAYDSTFNGGTPNNLQNGLGVNYINGSDIIVSHLSAAGDSLIASTYIGGSQNDGLNSTSSNATLNILRYNYADEIRGEIDIDKNNNIFIVSSTRSSDFPIVGNVFQPTYGGGAIDACVIKMDNSLQNIIWSSFLGGEKHDAGYSLAIDDNADIYVTGGTESDSFPTTSNVIGPSFNQGRSDGFVTHISKNGKQLINSTYYGSTAYDQSYFVELDKFNNVYLFGQSEITDSTFIKNVLWSEPGSGQFISKLNPQLDSLMYSTVFGSGNGINISPTAFLVDLCSKIYLTGWGGSVNNIGSLNNNAGFTNGMNITTATAQQTTTDGSDFYIMVLEDDASNIFYGSYFGGGTSSEHVDGGTSRFDRKGKVYQAICAGCGGNSDLPIEPINAHSSTNNNNCNLGVFKMDFGLPVVVADFDVPPISCAPFLYTFTNTSLIQSNTNYFWDFGDNTTSTVFNPTHTYTQSGTYTITLVLSDTATCNLADSIQKTIIVLGDTSYSITDISMCPGETKQIGILPNPSPSLTYSWTPSTNLSDTAIANPFATPPSTTNYSLLISNGVCTDTINQTVFVNTPLLDVTNDTILCFNETANLIANSFGTSSTYIWSSNNNFTDTLNSPITNNILSVNPTSTTIYYININNNGCELIDSVTVQSIGQSSISSPSSMCFGDTLNISYSNTNPGTFVNFDWSPNNQIISGDNTSQITVSPSVTTTYTIIAINDICIDTLTQTISVFNTQLSTSNDTVLCIDSSSVNLIANSFGTSNTFIWSSNVNFTDTLNASITDSNLTVTPLSASVYYVMINNNGCIAIDSVIVGLASSQTSVSDIIICEGDTATLTLINLNPFDSLTHDWSPDNLIISGDSTNSIVVSPLANSTYYVTSINSTGCIIIDTISVVIDSLPSTLTNAFVDDNDIYTGETTQLHAIPNGYNYQWSPFTGLSDPNSQNPLASPTITTTYTVTISGQGGCFKTNSVTIIVHEINCAEPDIFIPNAFTPNGDDENDILFVRGGTIEKMYLKIYDRWGELVFETDKQSQGWNGKYKDKLVDPGVFVYHLEITCIDGQEYFKKGNVTVIR